MECPEAGAFVARRVNAAFVALHTLSGFFFYTVGWPCGTDRYREWLRVTATINIILGTSGLLSTARWQKICLRLMMGCATIHTAVMTHTWCFSNPSWWLLMYLIAIVMYFSLAVLAPGFEHVQIAFHFVCIFCATIPSFVWAACDGARRLQENRPSGQESQSDDWIYATITYMSCLLTGIVGIYLAYKECPAGAGLRARHVLCYCCRRAARSSVAVADDPAGSGSIGSDQVEYLSEVSWMFPSGEVVVRAQGDQEVVTAVATSGDHHDSSAEARSNQTDPEAKTTMSHTDAAVEAAHSYGKDSGGDEMSGSHTKDPAFVAIVPASACRCEGDRFSDEQPARGTSTREARSKGEPNPRPTQTVYGLP